MRTPDLLVARIAELIHGGELAVGQHLPAQMLADRLKVSRSPVNAALRRLHQSGVLAREANRGYFVARALQPEEFARLHALIDPERDSVSRAYFQIAEDLLRGDLPQTCTESLLRQRYGLTAKQINGALARIASEGWAERRPGYGWEFSPMMNTPEALLQSYRFRLAVEPAALLEPGYKLERSVLLRCREAELHLLNGGIETDSADELHQRGVRYHESIVEASGNPFFIDAVRRVNRVRRLLSYRSMRDRARYRQHCEQHLEVLALLEQGRNTEASNALREHLQSTLTNLGKIQDILRPGPHETLVSDASAEN